MSAQVVTDPTAVVLRIEELVKAGKYAEALPLSEEDVRASERRSGPDDPAVASALLRLAEVLGRLGRYKDAEPPTRRALEIRGKAHGPDHVDVAVALNDLAVLHWTQGRYNEAEPLYKRALAIREKALGAEHADVAQSLANLGLLHWEQGRFSDAEPLYMRALAIREKAHGPDHDLVSDVLANLAILHMSQSRLGEAETNYKRALAIRERTRGASHPDVAQVLNNLALLYQLQARYAEAEPLQQRDLAITQGALGQDHPDLAATLNNLGTLLKLQGRYAEAEPHYLRALQIREQALGADHAEVGATLNNIAGLYQRQRRFPAAETYFLRAIAVSVKALGPDHPRVADISCNWGAFLKSEGRFEEAAPVLRRALEVAEGTLGPQHPEVARIAIQLAELLGVLGRTDEAEALFRRAGAVKGSNIKELKIFYGTNRRRDAKAKSVGGFGVEQADELLLGTVTVLVPPGNTGAEGRLTTEANRRPVSNVRQLTLRSPEPMQRADLLRAAREHMFGAHVYRGQALVFVHGFNTSFDDAVRRAGQLAYDLGFDGPVFAFSWPSREKFLGYVADQTAAQNSSEQLRDFLAGVVAETKARRVHIIAHSMGNYALNEALKFFDAGTMKKLNLGEIVHASPDLDLGQYKATLGKLLQAGAASTIYAASSDWALTLSSLLRDSKAQLGYIPRSGPAELPAGADYIDVTAVNSDVFALNHSIYADSPHMIEDLGRILKHGHRPPSARSKQVETVTAQKGGTYWRYRKPGTKP